MTGSNSELSRRLQASVHSGTTYSDVVELLAETIENERRVSLGGSGWWRQIVVTRDREIVILEYDRHDRLTAYGIDACRKNGMDAVEEPDQDLPDGLTLTLVGDAASGGDGR